MLSTLSSAKAALCMVSVVKCCLVFWDAWWISLALWAGRMVVLRGLGFLLFKVFIVSYGYGELAWLINPWDDNQSHIDIMTHFLVLLRAPVPGSDASLPLFWSLLPNPSSVFTLLGLGCLSVCWGSNKVWADIYLVLFHSTRLYVWKSGSPEQMSRIYTSITWKEILRDSHNHSS